MAGKNKVMLTFAGDSADLEKAFDRVGASADGMKKDIEKSGSSIDRAREGFDTVDTRAMGFRDTITGLQDGFRGLSDDSLPLGERLLMLGMGVGDLASGFANFLLPQLKQAVTWLSHTRVGILAQAAAARVAQAATVAWTVVQRILNAVLNASPMMKIVGLITLVGGVLAWLANKVGGFGNLWRIIWNGVASAARWVAGKVVGAWNWIKDTIAGVVNWAGGLGGRMWGWLTSGLKAAVNFAIGLLNGVIDGINWLIRGWNSASFLPGKFGEIGRIPVLHQGGVVPGAPGQEVLTLLQAGETVTPAGQGSQAPRTVHVDLGPEIMRIIRQQVRDEGGNVQIVLGQG